MEACDSFIAHFCKYYADKSIDTLQRDVNPSDIVTLIRAKSERVEAMDPDAKGE